MSWDKNAACKREDPELFFPLSYASDTPQVMAAKAICRHCPILTACRAYVTAHPQDDGIWAALTPRERRAHRATTRQEATR
ncbi:WhiB family transcriptional regulator [Streptosporangium sp. NPDC002721]|uniref:WhiB family transcriptional regulator n=1 Tax=Streptosporangium sp. NPDC002721 TaxID=3366188 RepID=UPI0036CB6F6B